MPLVIEAVRMLSSSFYEDAQLRQTLSSSLRMKDIPNDAFLILDSSNPVLQTKISLQGKIASPLN